MAFHEVQFPVSISRGSQGGPIRLTDVVTLRSGFEQRNTIWADSRRIYNAGLGLRNMKDIYEVLAFFEARRGRLHGFRWKDWADYKSVDPTSDISDTDISIGIGDGIQKEFQLFKTYSDASGSYTRTITKPVSESVLVALDGVAPPLQGYSIDTSGKIVFTTAPAVSVVVTAGFEFDVPVRFDIDQLLVNVEQFNVGAIPDITIMEIRI